MCQFVFNKVKEAPIRSPKNIIKRTIVEKGILHRKKTKKGWERGL